MRNPFSLTLSLLILATGTMFAGTRKPDGDHIELIFKYLSFKRGDKSEFFFLVIVFSKPDCPGGKRLDYEHLKSGLGFASCQPLGILQELRPVRIVDEIHRKFEAVENPHVYSVITKRRMVNVCVFADRRTVNNYF